MKPEPRGRATGESGSLVRRGSARPRRRWAASASARPVKRRSDREPRRSQTIVVGYDGSSAARAAVFLAARRAGDHGHVFVVYAYPMPPGYLGAPYSDRRLGDARRRGATALQELLHEHRSELPAADYVEELLGGPPAEAINNVARARDAQAIVIGYSGAGRLRAVLGRVSHRLLRIADRPVLIVPAPAPSSGQVQGSRAHRRRKAHAPSMAGWPEAGYLEPPWS